MSVISVVVPVYRSKGTLPELHRRLVAALEGIEPEFEIILVEDHGGDGSWEVIESLARADPRLRGIQLTKNFGQHAATMCGFAMSKGEWVITLDDDLEHDPDFIPQLYEKALEGYPLVYGSYRTRSHASWRNMTSNIGREMFRLAIPSLNYDYTSFRVIKGELAHAVARFDSPFPFIDGYLSWLTNSYACIPVPHGMRVQGRSNYGFRKLFTHTINIFVTFSDLPLRLATWLGFLAFFVGMGWLAFIVLARILGGITASGFASLMAGILLFGGIQLLVLGIFGEYLGRMNFKSSRKPLFLVFRETKDASSECDMSSQAPPSSVKSCANL